MSMKKVLVVDDNVDAAKTLSMLLKALKHEPHTAHDGEEALTLAGDVEPDLILLDLNLPKVNGADVCRQIRCRPGGERPAIFALSGMGLDEAREKMDNAGFSGHLVKPISLPDLQSLLATLPE